MINTTKSQNEHKNGLSWLLGLQNDINIEERLKREERIQDLLPDEDEDTIGKVYDGRLVSRLMQYMKPYQGQLYLSIVLMIFTSLLSVAAPWIIGQAIDQGIRAGSLISLRGWTIALITVTLIEWLTNRRLT